ncbi:hypothetical protein AB6Q85_003309 [Vibrio cholerae]
MALAKLCTFPTCKTVVRDGSHRCINHRQAKRTQEAVDRSQFYKTTSWRKLSLLKRKEHPICELCNKELVADVDHWLELLLDTEQTYALDPRNLVSTCKSCHLQKSAKVRQMLRHPHKNNIIYQWCINNHPRKEDIGYLHQWVQQLKVNNEELS